MSLPHSLSSTSSLGFSRLRKAPDSFLSGLLRTMTKIRFTSGTSRSSCSSTCSHSTGQHQIERADCFSFQFMSIEGIAHTSCYNPGLLYISLGALCIILFMVEIALHTVRHRHLVCSRCNLSSDIVLNVPNRLLHGRFQLLTRLPM